MLERFYSLTTKYPLDIVTYLASLFPLVAGLWRFVYLKNEHKFIVLFFLSDFITETYSLIIMLNGHSNWPVQDIHISINLFFVALVYQQALVRRTQKQLVSIVGLLFLGLSIYFYRGDIMSPWSQTVFRIYAIGATMAYYNAILSDLNLKKIQHHTMFWFTAGLLFYAGGTLFSMLFNQYLYAEDTPDSVFDRYWNLMQILYITFCLLATLGFWVSKHDSDNYFEDTYLDDNFSRNG